MNASFGMDHPLVATHNIEQLRARLISLGFNMTAIGKHPWGTSTSLAMFDGCLLEIMGIYDAALIDEVPAGDFHFGRHVYQHLQQREGVALTALHSTNSDADAERAIKAGFNLAGKLEFGRKVTLPDGSTDLTKTTLALLPDENFPRLSFFLCQQHRPELIYVPEWLKHPNQVTGICGVNVVSDDTHHDMLKKRFSSVYAQCESLSGGFQCQTANGVLRVLNADEFQRAVGPLPETMVGETLPFVAGMDFIMSEPKELLKFIKEGEFLYQEMPNGYVLGAPEQTANTTFRFFN